jgi:putative oxidoreductase
MSIATNPIFSWHATFVRVMNALQSAFLLLIRVYFGWQFAEAGWGKLQDTSRVVGFFTNLGIPAPHFTAVFVSGFELVGGILLALGLLSRIAALGIVTDMLVAFLTADHEAFMSFMSDPDKFVAAAPFLFLFVGLIVLFFGPGKYAIDSLLAKRLPARP